MAFSCGTSLEESTYRLLVGCKEEIRDLFLKKFSCDVELRGPKLTAHQAASTKADIVYKRRLWSGPVVSVWNDDLTKQDADVVVNAANEGLKHMAGLAGALLAAGGSVIEKDSKEYIQRHGELKTGEYAVTRPGKLPCKCLLHTVGPVWFDETPTKCDSELAESIRNVMSYVSKHTDIKSVAIPAVSSGIFGFPLLRCADIIVKTIESSVGLFHVKEIRLVNNNDPAVQAMKSACERILGPSDNLDGANSTSGNQPWSTTRSENFNGATSTSGNQPWSATQRDHLNGATSTSGNQTGPVTRSMTSSSQPSPSGSSYKAFNAQPSGSSSEMSPPIFINGLRLHLISGLIEEQKTQIIVNSVSSTLHLQSGAISKAIAFKAGHKLQEEIGKKWSDLCRKYHTNNIRMIPTRGFQLHCDFVYHVILPLVSSNNDPYALQCLSHVTMECLSSAHAHKSRSISFPALGTGGIGLSKQKVAEVMTGTVTNFATVHQKQLDVYFVIHPNDRDTYQVFQDQMNRYRPFSYTAAPAAAERPDPTFNMHEKSIETPEIPQLIINASSSEDLEEAKAWLTDVLQSQTVFIQNNLVLLFGKEEHNFLSSPDFPDVSMEEILHSGTSGVKIDGPTEDKVKAVIQVEQLFLDVQEKLAVTLEEELLEAAVAWFYENEAGARKYPTKANRELEKAFVTQCDITLTSEPYHMIFMKNLNAEGKNGKLQLQRRTVRKLPKDILKKRQPEDWIPQVVLVDPKSQEFKDSANKFKKDKLTLVKMEKIQNRYLSDIFHYKKEAKPSSKKTSHLYHLVPRQFTKLVCNVGFQRILSSPKDTKFGQGIYFADSPRRAMECFCTPKAKDRFLYIFQAEVLASDVVVAKDSEFLLPQKPNKAKADDILDLCDSLVNSTISPSVYVIPDGFHANPVFLFTCKRCE